jgi:hypothetical protein
MTFGETLDQLSAGGAAGRVYGQSCATAGR